MARAEQVEGEVEANRPGEWGPPGHVDGSKGFAFV